MGSDNRTIGNASADVEDDQEQPILRRSPRIKEAEVHTIADQLLLEGHRPSVDRIRAKLGRGSPNTIALFLDRWWSNLGARLRDLPGSELPPVPADVAHSMHALWTQAIDHARTLLHDTLEEQSRALTQQREQLQVRSAELFREKSELARERHALEHAVNMAQAQVAEANERHRLDTARLAELEQERGRLQQSLSTLQHERDALASRLDAAQQAHQHDVRTLNERMEATERHWMREVDEARQAAAVERKSVHMLEKQLAEARASHSAHLQEHRTILAEKEQQLSVIGAAVKAAEQERARLESAHAEQVRRADRALQLLQESQQQAARQIDLLQGQLHQQTAQLAQLTAKITPRSSKARNASRDG